MSSVIIAGDVSGTVTLQAPSAAGSTVVTLPSSSMNLGNGGGSIATNTALGTNALASNTTGANNTAVGYLALNTNTSGAPNSAFGAYSLYSNTTGTYNTALGGSDGVNGGTLSNNTTGSYNTAIGIQALKTNTTASNNTAVGYQAAYSNTTGASNVALGYQAGYTASTANYNVSVGYQAGYSLNSPSNVFIGHYAGQTAAGASNGGNLGIGAAAGLAITTGSMNTIVGSCIFGSTNAAGQVLTTGSYNTFIGPASGNAITTGSKNSILGAYNGNQGGLDIRTASNYIVLSDGDGNPRGFFNDSGYFRINNTDAGNYLFRIKFDGASQEAVGLQTSYASGGNMIRFLNSSFTTVGLISVTNTATTYATSSDYRLKENVQPMTSALATVAQLKPVTYKWKTDGADGQGFIAHELQAVVPEAVVGEKDAVDADGNPVYQGIDTSFLVATLTAAIQELNAKVDAQAAEIAALKGQA